MVEFTIVLPVLLLLLFGVTELGRALVRYNTLTKAVQDGARYAAAYALLGTTGAVNVDAQLQTEVRNVVVYGNTAGTGTPVLGGLATGADPSRRRRRRPDPRRRELPVPAAVRRRFAGFRTWFLD